MDVLASGAVSSAPQATGQEGVTLCLWGCLYIPLLYKSSEQTLVYSHREGN